MRRARAWLPQWFPLLVVASHSLAVASAVQARARANPIRKVVTLLQKMERKVREEGDKQHELFDKFMCFCKSTDGGLSSSIASAEEGIPQLESYAKQASAERDQIASDLEKTKSDMASAEAAVKEADALRAKDAQAFEKESADTKTNINALGQAIDAISSGGGSSFLQSSAASVLRQLSLSTSMNGDDIDLLQGFLAGGGSQSHDPQSGEVLGMLKQMKSDMAERLAESTSEEEQARRSHDSLVAAKKKEVNAASKAVEDKTGRLGKLAVDIVTLQNQLEYTKEGLAEDKAFLADMLRSCKQKQEEWELYQKLQSQEVVAIADTIKLLNDDDALDLFKKSLPTAGLAQTDAPGFLQVRAARAPRRASGRAGGPRLKLVEMALRGKKAGMEQIVGMIDDLVRLLDEEQSEDDEKKRFCEKEIDHVEDEAKVRQRLISDKETVITETKDSLETVRKDIESLAASIQKLDLDVKQATLQRKAEHALSVEAEAETGIARRVLELAKQKLTAFYHRRDDGDSGGPAAASAASFAQLNSEEADEDTGANGAETRAQGAQPPQGPDLSYRKSHEAAGGATQMIEMLQSDLTKQIEEIKQEEKYAQEAYEEFLLRCKRKRAIDAKSVSEKEGVKAELEASLQEDTVATKNARLKMQSTVEELSGLHKDCDWVLQYYEVRKQARVEERDSLLKAKAVLSTSR